MELASFFAGIGGFDLGFERAGIKTIWQCEIDRYCRQVLEKHWPDVARAEDIKKVDADAIPDSAVWAGGFPCQDVSLARMSKREGLKGKKSGLFYDFAGLIEKRLPKVVVIENVGGLLSSHNGKDFRVVVQTLAGLGYGVGWRVLNSRFFGVPQSRRRVYIVGCYRDPTRTFEILHNEQCGKGDNTSDRQNGKKAISPFKKILGNSRKGPIHPALAYCLYACSARHTGTDWSRNYISYPNGRVRRLLPIECERIQGFPDGWTLPPEGSKDDVDRVDSLRYHALGNAVTVNVTEWLARRIVATEPKPKKKSKKINGRRSVTKARTRKEPVCA